MRFCLRLYLVILACTLFWSSPLYGQEGPPQAPRPESPPAQADEVDEVSEDSVSVPEEVPYSRNQAPKVFLDCNRCDFAYVREEITFVNYVRDPELAQIHVFVTDQRTGSGGRIYTMSFTGQQNFSGVEATLSYTSQNTNTYAEERRGVTELLKLGLVPYIARTPLAEQMRVSFQGSEELEPEPLEDPWNSWVFDVDANGSFDLESTRSSYSFGGGLEARRVTEAWKTGAGLNWNYRQRNFESGEDVISSVSRWGGFSTFLVKSLTEHWSAGVFSDVTTSTFRNIDLNLGLTPAVEYNIFPYSESSRKELTFSYRIGYDYRWYIEETIFQEMEESLLQQSLHANVRIRQPWGFIFAGLSGSHYFHDFSKNSLDFSSNVSLRLVKGLSLRITSNFELINDQLYLPAGDASLEDLLLQQRQLATSFEMSGSIGFAYTFGSIYTNVVNTRL